MRSKDGLALSAALLAMLSGCSTGSQAGQRNSELTATVQRLQAENAETNKRLGMVEQSLPVLVCGPELRALLNRVRQECSVAPTGVGANATCSTNKLKGAMTQAQHEMQASSIGLALLSILRHEVIYLDDHSDHPTSTRETRLATLAGEKVAKDTRFIVVVSPERGVPAAERRAKLVIEQLKQLGIDPIRIERPWIYDLPIPLNQLKPADRPGTAEPKAANRAIFILRTEC